MTRQNGLVIVTISFYIMYGYLGMPGQGAFAIPFLLNEAILAIVSGVMVYYQRAFPAQAFHLSLVSLSALAISPFFLEIILPLEDLTVLMESGWYDLLKLIHYLVICSLMVAIAWRQTHQIQRLCGVGAIALLTAGVGFGFVWIFLPAYILMVCADFSKERENSTTPLWTIMAFLELTRLVAMWMS